MTFADTQGQPDPAAQPLTLTNSGTGDWNGGVTSDMPWLTIAPNTNLSVAANGGTLAPQVSVTLVGTVPGTNTGHLTFDDGNGHTLVVTVNFNVRQGPYLAKIVFLDPPTPSFGLPTKTIQPQDLASLKVQAYDQFGQPMDP